MENHPIPQDVTGFQFKLVGSMTLKQFGYVGAGVILAVIFFYSPLAWFVKLPLVPFLAITGISLAFLPVAGRPLDLMAGYFMKAVIKPNQFVYQKIGGSLSFAELNLQPVLPAPVSSPAAAVKNKPQNRRKEEQLLTYLYNTATDSGNPLDQRENQFVTALFSQPNISQSTQPVPPSAQNGQNPDAAPRQPVQPLPPLINPQPVIGRSTIQPVSQGGQQAVIPQPVVSAGEQIYPPGNNTTPSAKSQSETASIKDTSAITMQTIPPPTLVQVVPADQTVQPSQNAPVQPARATYTGMDFPNIVRGIVKDPRGNILSGILVEVLNKDNDPVRAFKTNLLGQFSSATQLSNGAYKIAFEDPKGEHKFNSVQIETNGSVLTPLTIVSIDGREELRRSLFG